LTFRRSLSAMFSRERPGKRVQIGDRQVVVEGLPRNFGPICTITR